MVKIKTWKKTKLKQTVLKLMKEKKEISKEKTEYKAANNKVQRTIRLELRTYKTKQIFETIESNRKIEAL